jgi:hypothetical protein
MARIPLSITLDEKLIKSIKRLPGNNVSAKIEELLKDALKKKKEFSAHPNDKKLLEMQLMIENLSMKIDEHQDDFESLHDLTTKVFELEEQLQKLIDAQNQSNE